MTKIKDLPTEELEDEDDVPDEKSEDRKKDYVQFKYVRKQLAEIYETVDKAFEDKLNQREEIAECWDIYNCTLNEHQNYNGSSQVYIPIVRDAMNARATRFVNVLFPQNGRYADVVDNGGKVPYDLIALLDNYVGRAKLRQIIAPGLVRNGDISGNYSLYAEWSANERFIVNKIKVPERKADNGEGIEGSEEYDDVEYQKVQDEHPAFSLLDTRNLVVLPADVDTIDNAEIVAVALHYTKSKIRKMVKAGVFEKEPAERLIANLSESKNRNNPDISKDALRAAGVEKDSKGNKQALILQVWKVMEINGKRRMMVSHFGGPEIYLGCKRNPNWNDRIPVGLQAVEKEGESIWGKSQVGPVKEMQYYANDTINMGFDSAQYALMPIVLTDPEKNPNVGSMVLSMAAVWLSDPNSTKFAEFPKLWQDAFAIVGSCKDQIMQSMGINPAMLPHAHQTKKPSQAEVAQEQQVALESSNDEVMILESVLSWALEWMYDMDYQYRTKEITVKKYGQLGLQATMDQVKPFQTRERLYFRWYGLESFKAAQQVQSMISWGNVLQGMPPQALNGRRVDLGPMLEYITEITCGPRIAPHVLIDQRHELTIPPETENEWADNGFPVQTHPMDNDPEHLQVHMQHYKLQPSDHLKGHILEHIKQMRAKAEAQQQQTQGPAPGGAGGPKPGATAQMPTGLQKPPGALPTDKMPLAMPRKAM